MKQIDEKIISVRVKPAMHREVRIRAIIEDRSMQNLVEEALTDYLKKVGAQEVTPA